jgi:hypothetical protein
MLSSYQVALWKQESFGVLRPLQIEFFRSLLERFCDQKGWLGSGCGAVVSATREAMNMGSLREALTDLDC